MWVDEWAEWTPEVPGRATRPMLAWRSVRQFTLFYTADNPLGVGMALYAEDGEVVLESDGTNRVAMLGGARKLKDYPDDVGVVARVERAPNNSGTGGFAVFCDPPGIPS